MLRISFPWLPAIDATLITTPPIPPRIRLMWWTPRKVPWITLFYKNNHNITMKLWNKIPKDYRKSYCQKWKQKKESGYEPQSKFFHGLLLLQYLLGQDASSSQGYLPPWDVLWDFLESLLVITDTSGQRGHIVQVKRHSPKTQHSEWLLLKSTPRPFSTEFVALTWKPLLLQSYCLKSLKVGFHQQQI